MPEQLGTFDTRQLVIPAGGEAQFDTNADQLLCLELDNAAAVSLIVNNGGRGELFKGLEIRGQLRQVRVINTAADQVTVKLALVKGLELQDRRLNQVGDLGLVTSYATFQPVAIVSIPGQSVRTVAEADADRRYIMLSNPPGQFREIYISGAAVNNLGQVTFGNQDFEDPTPSGSGNPWSGIIAPPHVGGGNWIISAGGAVITAPHGGSGMLWQDGNTGQTVTEQESSDLVSAQGFDAALIDSAQLTYEASIWAASEDNDSADLQLTWKDGVGGSTLRTDLLDNAGVSAFASAGWQRLELTGIIPIGARAVRVLLRENGGGVEKAFDDFQLLVNGSPPTLDELAGFIMPAESRLLPTSGAIFAYNPHATAQNLLVGEIKAT